MIETKISKQEIIDKLEEIGIEIVKVNGVEICAKCPIHHDTNPSFFFNLENHRFHCFAGCLKGRGLHQLIYKVTGVSQKGNPVKEVILHKFISNRNGDKKIIPTIPLLPLALDNEGEKYLMSRGFGRDIVKEWQIRYWDEEAAIVIPIEDKGFVLRYISKAAEKKYKYVSGTRITETLFGLGKLPKTLTSIILVEGSLDCIHLHQIGFPNSLGLLHADISIEQIKVLGGVTDYVYLMLDGDEPGREAAQKIRKYLVNRFIVKTCNLPSGKDPADLTKEEIIQSLNTSI